jgi:hypothetical protein
MSAMSVDVAYPPEDRVVEIFEEKEEEEEAEAEEEDTFLNDTWSVYFHDPLDVNWNLQSYIRLHNICTVEDFWTVHHALAGKLCHGMFFFMRIDTFPCWDDPSNIKGGCLSMKVLKENLEKFWLTMCMRVASETLLLPQYHDKHDVINGISASPKKYFCVVKIWLRTHELDSKRFFNIPHQYNGDIFYKKNMETIQSQSHSGATPTPVIGGSRHSGSGTA